MVIRIFVPSLVWWFHKKTVTSLKSDLFPYSRLTTRTPVAGKRESGPMEFGHDQEYDPYDRTCLPSMT